MNRPRGFELWLAATIVVADQITKALIRERLRLGESISVIENVFDLTLVHNTGAAFGLLNDVEFPFKTAVLVMVAAVALAGIAAYTMMLPVSERLARLGLAFILGGAAGNLIDRIAYGYVVDFVDLYWGNWHFWAFNVADASITIGVVLMVLDLLGVGQQRVSRAV